MEDDETLNMVLAQILTELGACVASFSNAEDALIGLLENHGACSLVIADHGVPGALKGLEFLQMVAEKWPHIPAILTSGYQLQPTGAPPVTFLFKPWSVEELLSAIGQAMAGDSIMGVLDQ
ncbi:response regulator [Pseudomonas sp. SIMBA_068]|uniref:response regulator n=1 Tax=Pseudomonas sp. SIMBA_068 TaxID=3085808 RepID=UPI00397B8CC7